MGGWGKIKNKDQLSLAEARVEAELGKICGETNKGDSVDSVPTGGRGRYNRHDP